MYNETTEGPQKCRQNGCPYAAGDDGYCSDTCEGKKTHPMYMGVCRDCTWNGRKRRDGGEAVEDAARHNMRTNHTWNVLEAVGPNPVYGTWKVSDTY